MARRKKEMNPAELQEYAEAFCEAAPVGTAVRYYPVVPCGEDDFEDSVIRSAPWGLCGRPVVMIDGRRGGVDVSHLALINPKKDIGGVAGLIRRA
jgi:hypothetical protein